MLYQLFKNQFTNLGGGFIQIDGPYDKYGKLLSEERFCGTFLIRGLGFKNPTK